MTTGRPTMATLLDARRTRPWWLWPLVLGLHLALWRGLVTLTVPPPAAATPARIAIPVRWVAAPAPPTAAPRKPALAALAAWHERNAPASPPRPHASRPDTATLPAGDTPVPAAGRPLSTDSTPAPAAPVPDLAAEPRTAGQLLNSDATRRALREATRGPLLSERFAAASDEPERPTAQQRFGREVARSAYGNCLQGEFPGAGAGLLSLPMFLIAEASGKCQK